MGNTDSALEWALKWNKTNAIQYNGLWYPKGTLQRLLDSAPKPKESKEDD
jgi:hypothetical protein